MAANDGLVDETLPSDAMGWFRTHALQPQLDGVCPCCTPVHASDREACRSKRILRLAKPKIVAARTITATSEVEERPNLSGKMRAFELDS